VGFFWKFISPTYGVRIGHRLLYRVFGEVAMCMDISFHLETKVFGGFLCCAEGVVHDFNFH
jgi:hypothetical protein